MNPLVPLALALALPGLAAAGTRTLAPGDDLAAAIASAAPGDELILSAGVHAGPVTLGRAVTLRGEPGAVLDGGGEGSVVTVTAPGVIVRGLTIRGSGRDRAAMDSGVVLTKGAKGALVERNTFVDNLHGVHLYGAPDATVRGNAITGRTGRQADSGNGVMIWNAPGALIENNDVRFGRDGIFTRVSKHDVFRGNRFEKTRFAIHYMYTSDSVIEDNVSIDNTVGYAIMFSDRLKIVGNVSDGDRDLGLMLNSSNRSEIRGNRVTGRELPAARWLTSSQGADEGMAPASDTPIHAGGDRIGPEKCLFVFNANKNIIEDNHFEGCGIGIHFTAGAEGNAVAGNAFIGNQTQVKYVGTRTLDWSAEGRGNYWSDNAAFDLDGDGIADAAYRPNDIIDRVMWTAPQARLLVTSPAVQVIRWAQSRFPATLPGGVLDSAPLMAPPPESRPMTETTAALHGVSKRYGAITAVRDLDLALHAGEVIALVGHNGSGKTTQIKMMLGLARPTSGRVTLLGADPATDGFALRREIGYLPESVSFHLALTGRETLGFYARLKGVPAAALDAAFAAVGLDGAADRAVGTYSKGMRQRLGLAQALLGRPRVLFLDEPTSGLDPALRREFYAIVARRAAEGATVLLASHALTELEGSADRVVIVNRGAKIADGTLSALRSLARLPVQVRVRPSGAFAEQGWRPLADGSFERAVPPEGKLKLLADLLADPAALRDISVTEPTLDDLYAHFLRREAA